MRVPASDKALRKAVRGATFSNWLAMFWLSAGVHQVRCGPQIRSSGSWLNSVSTVGGGFDLLWGREVGWGAEGGGTTVPM
jgi:hypothetical protein